MHLYFVIAVVCTLFCIEFIYDKMVHYIYKNNERENVNENESENGSHQEADPFLDSYNPSKRQCTHIIDGKRCGRFVKFMTDLDGSFVHACQFEDGHPLIKCHSHTIQYKTYIPYTEECAICLSNACDVITDCGHYYHEQCLLAWFAESRTCPECRTRVMFGHNSLHKNPLARMQHLSKLERDFSDKVNNFGSTIQNLMVMRNQAMEDRRKMHTLMNR